MFVVLCVWLLVDLELYLPGVSSVCWQNHADNKTSG